MSRPSRTAVLLAAVLLMQASAAAVGGPRQDRDDRYRGMPPGLLAPGLRDSQMQRQRLSPDDAAREIQGRHGGRVLAVQPDGGGYRVKTLKDGEVRIYQVDP